MSLCFRALLFTTSNFISTIIETKLPPFLIIPAFLRSDYGIEFLIADVVMATPMYKSIMNANSRNPVLNFTHANPLSRWMVTYTYVHYTLQPVKHLCALLLNLAHGSVDSLEYNLIELYPS